MKLLEPLSVNTNFLEFVPLPRIVTSPLTVAPVAAIVPLVAIVVLPVISALPVIVPPLISGVVSALLLRVWLLTSVTITPEVGNTADELTPVPPDVVGSVPVTAAGCDRLMAAKVGELPSAGTVKL